MKCSICNETVEKTFLAKPIGTYVKDESGKKHIVCNECQSTYSVEEIREKL